MEEAKCPQCGTMIGGMHHEQNDNTVDLDPTQHTPPWHLLPSLLPNV